MPGDIQAAETEEVMTTRRSFLAGLLASVSAPTVTRFLPAPSAAMWSGPIYMGLGGDLRVFHNASPWVPGDVISLAVDFDAKKVWYCMNNPWDWPDGTEDDDREPIAWEATS